MSNIRHADHFLGRHRGLEQTFAKFDRDELVAGAVNDHQGRIDLFDVVDRGIFIVDESPHWKQRIHQFANGHNRGERGFEHHGGGLPPGGQLGGNTCAKRFTVSYDFIFFQTKHPQIVIGRHSIGNVARFSRAAFTAPITAVAEHEEPIAAARDLLDAIAAHGQVAFFAMKVKQRWFAGLGTLVPRNEFGAILGFKG